jgi:O-antigen ligase
MKRRNKIFTIDSFMQAILYGLGVFGFYLTLYVAVILYIPSRVTTIPFRALMLGAAFISFTYFLQKERRFYKGKLWVALVVFWGFYAIQVIFEPVELLMNSKKEYFLYAYGICGIPMLAYFFELSREKIRAAWLFMVGSALLTGFCSMVLYGGASAVWRVKGGDFIGDFVAIGPLHLSYLGSALVVLGMYSLFVRESFNSTTVRLAVSGLLSLMGLYLIALGASKGPVLAVLVTVACYGGARVRGAFDILRLFGGVVAMAVVACVALLMADSMGSALVSRFEELLNFRETYTFGGFGIERFFIYQMAFDQFLENPFLGNGLFVHEVLGHPHNFILEAYMTTGIFGGTAFLVYFCTCVVRAIKLMRHLPEVSWVSFLFFHYAVYGQLSSSMMANNYFWYTSAMVIGVYEFSGLRTRRGNMPIQVRRGG